MRMLSLKLCYSMVKQALYNSIKEKNDFVWISLSHYTLSSIILRGETAATFFSYKPQVLPIVIFLATKMMEH